jgi:hypothetical protein
MTITNRPFALDITTKNLIRETARTLGADVSGSNLMTATFRAADQRRRGIVPATLQARFKSAVAGQDGPSIGQVLDAAGI